MIRPYARIRVPALLVVLAATLVAATIGAAPASAASRLVFSFNNGHNAATGQPFYFTMYPENANGGRDTAYTGTVTFSGTGGAVFYDNDAPSQGVRLPNDQYTWKGAAEPMSQHDFYVIFQNTNGGNNSITATDNSNPPITVTEQGITTTGTPGGGGGGGGTAAITVSPTTAAPGQSLTISGSGFQGNETVTVTADSGAQVATGTANNGSFTATGAVPAGISPGTHTITARGNTSGLTATATITVNNSTTATTIQNPYGGNPYGGNPYGGNPYGGNPYGGNPYGGGPYTGDPYAGSLYGGYPPSASYGPCPGGYVFNGAACVASAAYAQPTTATPAVQSVGQPAGQALAAVQSRVPLTGVRTTHLAALALSLIFGGLLLVAARRAIAS